MARQIQGAQRDFSFGEIDVELKRSDDHPARKGGLRQMANARILNSGAVQDRPGRRALFPTSNGATRIEEFTISPGNVYKIGFAAGRLQIINSAGAIVANFTLQGNGSVLPWTANNLNTVVYAIFGLSIYVTFAGMRPQVITWDGVSTWTITDYNELVLGGQKRTPFYRIAPQGIAIQPSAQTGAVTINTTAAVPAFNPAQVGTCIRFVNRQILITGYVNNHSVTGTVQESLPGSQAIQFLVDPAATFSIGDVVVGSVTGSKGLITALPGGNTIRVQLLFQAASTVLGTTFEINDQGNFLGKTTTLNTFAFTVDDIVAGPGGSIKINSVAAIGVPEACTIWDEEVINAYRGYPASCFVDQFRLGFCNFPAVPGGIAWSAINAPTDLNVGANPSNAIFEITPSKTQVYYVVPGPESSEFVFCDTRLYYIKIDASNPLKPGSVGFQTLSGDGCAQVQPRVSQEVILYVNAGLNSVMAIIASGAYYRPFNTKNLTDFHNHLFNGIRAIAVPTFDGTINERYAYVLNGDGSIAVGKYRPESLQSNLPVIGWGPWSGAGSVTWIAAWNADVLFTSSYFGIGVCEIVDETQYLDCAISVNALPAAFTAPVGKGPLWFIPSQSVTLIDQVTRMMGTYQIDANGFIVPQNNGGENLAIASLVAGQPWTMTVEPFCPVASSGADVGQRMDLRYIARFAVYVVNSTGFMLAKLFSAKQTATSPALGTVMNSRRIPPWNQDDDATLPPKLRETTESWRPAGGSFDPRVAVIKDTPGPLQILELGIECTL
jgi:hypothetical protein